MTKPHFFSLSFSLRVQAGRQASKQTTIRMLSPSRLFFILAIITYCCSCGDDATRYHTTVSAFTAITTTATRKTTQNNNNNNNIRNKIKILQLNSSPENNDDNQQQPEAAPPPPPPPPPQLRPPPPAVPMTRIERQDPLIASLTRDNSEKNSSSSQQVMTVPFFGEIDQEGLYLLVPAFGFALIGFVYSIVVAFQSSEQIVSSLSQSVQDINPTKRVYDKNVCRGLCSSQQDDLDGMKSFMEAITRSAREGKGEAPQ